MNCLGQRASHASSVEVALCVGVIDHLLAVCGGEFATRCLNDGLSGADVPHGCSGSEVDHRISLSVGHHRNLNYIKFTFLPLPPALRILLLMDSI